MPIVFSKRLHPLHKVAKLMFNRHPGRWVFCRLLAGANFTEVAAGLEEFAIQSGLITRSPIFTLHALGAKGNLLEMKPSCQHSHPHPFHRWRFQNDTFPPVFSINVHPFSILSVHIVSQILHIIHLEIFDLKLHIFHPNPPKKKSIQNQPSTINNQVRSCFSRLRFNFLPQSSCNFPIQL